MDRQAVFYRRHISAGRLCACKRLTRPQIWLLRSDDDYLTGRRINGLRTADLGERAVSTDLNMVKSAKMPASDDELRAES